MSQDVTFIRKNGRVIPIRSNKPSAGERAYRGASKGVAVGAAVGGALGAGLGAAARKGRVTTVGAGMFWAQKGAIAGAALGAGIGLTGRKGKKASPESKSRVVKAGLTAAAIAGTGQAASLAGAFAPKRIKAPLKAIGTTGRLGSIAVPFGLAAAAPKEDRAAVFGAASLGSVAGINTGRISSQVIKRSKKLGLR